MACLSPLTMAENATQTGTTASEASGDTAGKTTSDNVPNPVLLYHQVAEEVRYLCEYSVSGSRG